MLPSNIRFKLRDLMHTFLMLYECDGFYIDITFNVDICNRYCYSYYLSYICFVRVFFFTFVTRYIATYILIPGDCKLFLLMCKMLIKKK